MPNVSQQEPFQPHMILELLPCMNARPPVLEHSQHKRHCEAPWANSGREVEAYLARVGVGEKSQQARPVWALNGSSCSHANPRK